LKHDFMKVFELYDAADKTIFYGNLNLKEEENRKQYLIEIKNEGAIFADLNSNNNLKYSTGDNLSGLIKLVGFDWDSKIFEELNDKFYDLVKKYNPFNLD